MDFSVGSKTPSSGGRLFSEGDAKNKKKVGGGESKETERTMSSGNSLRGKKFFRETSPVFHEPTSIPTPSRPQMKSKQIKRSRDTESNVTGATLKL